MPPNDKTPEVADKLTESGIKVNNILTFMILGVMSWVGLNIMNMKDSMAHLQTKDAILQIEVDHLHKAYKEFNDECDKRWHRVEEKLDNLRK